MKTIFGSTSVLFAVAAMFMTIFVTNAPAQKRQGQANALRDVQGMVADASGAPVVGAVVQLKNTKTLEIISFITKDQGQYYFHGLSPDIDFEISAQFGDKSSAVRTLSTFDTRKQSVLNLKLDRPKKT